MKKIVLSHKTLLIALCGIVTTIAVCVMLRPAPKPSAFAECANKDREYRDMFFSDVMDGTEPGDYSFVPGTLSAKEVGIAFAALIILNDRENALSYVHLSKKVDFLNQWRQVRDVFEQTEFDGTQGEIYYYDDNSANFELEEGVSVNLIRDHGLWWIEE